MKYQIAILLTCHNRKNVTVRCLSRLRQINSGVDVYCVDDASTDGTADSIRDNFPNIVLIQGDGNLFWCRGMNLAWKTARLKKDYDFYVWLNDDLLLFENAFDELLECSKINNHRAIIGGIIQGIESGKAIYGGFNENHQILCPNGLMQNIHNLNGNFVIIPKYVFNKLGFFDDYYHHDIGDVDYGLMAKESGIPVLTSRCFIGSTEENLKGSGLRIRKENVNILKRFKKLYSPLGCNPFIDFHFMKKHKGIVWAVLDFLYLHFINILPDYLFYRLFPKYKNNK